ncbi:uncharacterized protein METZ01_LOCUS320486, partial [marine metagenome]
MTGNVWEWCTNFKPSGPYGNSLCVRIPCCAAVGVTKIKQ